MKKKIIIKLIILFISTSLLHSEYIQAHFKFVKQGFCTEVKDRKSKDFPYLIKCKSDGVWGLRKETVKSGDKHYFVLKNFVTEKFKYIGPLTPTEKIEGFDFNKQLLSFTHFNRCFHLYYSDFDVNDTLLIKDYYISQTKVTYMNNEISIIDSSIYLNRSYPGELLNGRSSTTYIQTIDINSKKSNYHNFPIPKGEYFGIIGPSKTFAFSKNFIAQSDRTEYKINIYDHNLSKVASINKEWEIPNRVFEDDFNRFQDTMNYKVLSQINGLFSHFNTTNWDKLCNHIRKIDFINDSMLLVCYAIPSTDSIINLYTFQYTLYDIWKYSNNKWSLHSSNIKDSYNFERNFVSKFLVMFSYNYQIGNDYVFLESNIPFLLNDKISFEEYKKKKNEYYLENSDPHGYFIYHFDK